MLEMTNNNNDTTRGYICIHEDRIHQHEAQLQRLETRADYKHDQIQQILSNMNRFENKLDKLLETQNTQNTNTDHRITTIETKLAVQEKTTDENYTKTMITISIVGLFLTALTILLNHLHI